MPLERSEPADLPIESVEPYPKVLMRFDYNDESIVSLAEKIRAQGQLQRGRVFPKPDGKGNEIYIGNRRYYAVRFLHGKYGAPAVYKAEIDYGLTEEEIIVRALMENEEGQGERKPLSLEEELAYFGALLKDHTEAQVISIGEKAGRDGGSMVRRMRTAISLGEKLRRLYEVEKRGRFRFNMGHLEELAAIPDDPSMFKVACVVAKGRFEPGQVKPDAAQELVKGIGWFAELFPEYSSGDGAAAATAKVKAGEGTGRMPHPLMEPQTNFVKCPHCGATNPFNDELDATLTFLGLRKDGTWVRKPVEPLGLYITPVECNNPQCVGRGGGEGSENKQQRGGFWAIVCSGELSEEGGAAKKGAPMQSYKSETEAKAILSSLRGRVMRGALRYDQNRQRFVVVDEAGKKFELDEHYRLREIREKGGGGDQK